MLQVKENSSGWYTHRSQPSYVQSDKIQWIFQDHPTFI
jgi:hypothetical protein